jgi:lipopolysaccharide export system protein LptA
VKTFCLIALMAATAGPAARAQSGTNAAPPPPRVTHIDSDSADFDGNGHTVTYCGHVHVSDPAMNLTCARLVADLPEAGGRPSRIVAETNVVIDSTDSKGQTTHVTGDQAVYIYNVQNGVTNETVTLTGNPQPQVKNAQGTMAADVITWDRANNGYRFTGNYHMVSDQNFSVMTDTNLPPANTNNLTTPKINSPPGADTNFPPGKLDLVAPRQNYNPPPNKF